MGHTRSITGNREKAEPGKREGGNRRGRGSNKDTSDLMTRREQSARDEGRSLHGGYKGKRKRKHEMKGTMIFKIM